MTCTQSSPFCNEYGAPDCPSVVVKPCSRGGFSWIREFESSYPSPPVRSFLFDFRLRASARAGDRSRCHILEGAGQYIQPERVSAVNELLPEFLRGL